MDYKSRAKVTFLESEIQRLQKLLKDNNVSYAPLDGLKLDNYWGFYLTIYVKQDGTYRTKVTMYHPIHKSNRLRVGDINSYGWQCKYILQCRIPQ